MRDGRYFVYILASPTRTLYVGVTNDLERRIWEHREKLVLGFTARYGVTLLVHWEETSDVREAIAREKVIKGWLRIKKVMLIESGNPDWRDLGEEWFGPSSTKTGTGA